MQLRFATMKTVILASTMLADGNCLSRVWPKWRKKDTVYSGNRVWNFMRLAERGRKIPVGWLYYTTKKPFLCSWQSNCLMMWQAELVRMRPTYGTSSVRAARLGQACVLPGPHVSADGRWRLWSFWAIPRAGVNLVSESHFVMRAFSLTGLTCTVLYG